MSNYGNEAEHTISGYGPLPASPLIGREQEVKNICTCLQRPEVRLLTLTGTGGVGKTRLGLQVASELEQFFADGVYFVPLAAISDPDLVMLTIAQTFGIKEARGRQPFDLLKELLREKQLLLVLDNFEQVEEAAPNLCELLDACSLLKIAVTSRAVLHLQGEHIFPVLPLVLPDLKHDEDLEQYAAVALFLQRARAVKPGFQLTNSNKQTIAEICVRLDGLPLAIELAVARMKILSPRALLERLEHRLQLLTGGASETSARQQTLWNTLTWSYELLTPGEQQVFRRLSVFVGDCRLKALEQVCKEVDGPKLSVLDAVESLLDKSLLQQVEQEGDEPHLRMLETIREYGLETLTARGELEATRQAHAACYLAFAQEAEPHLLGAEQDSWLNRLEQDHENLRAALDWSLEHADEHVETALRIGGALWRFWWARGYLTEGRNFLERALRADRGAKATVRAKSLNAAGILNGLQGNYAQAKQFCQEGLVLFRALDDQQGVATALQMQGQMAGWQSKFAAARSLAEEALELSREAGDKWGIASSLDTLATVALNRGEYVKSYSLAQEALALSREVGDRAHIAHSLWLLGLLILYQSDYARAHAMLTESLTLSQAANDKRGIADAFVVLGYVAFFQGGYAAMAPPLEKGLALHREIGDQRGIASGLYGIGWLALGRGDYAQARAAYEESVMILKDLEHQWFLALSLEGLACTVATQGQAAWAARLCGVAEMLRASIGASMPPAARIIYEQTVAAARTQLGDEDFTAAWAEGREMTVEQVLIARGPLLKAEPAPLPSPPSPAPAKSPVPTLYPNGLTRREVEVLRLVAQGKTDEQVGQELSISPRTVSTHLTSIYGKISVPSRSAATRYALDHHLT